MSGWISSNFGTRLWRAIYHKLPDSQRENIRKGVDKADEVFTEEYRKEHGLPPVSTEQHPTMPQAEVNKKFRAKEDMIRRQSFPKH